MENETSTMVQDNHPNFKIHMVYAITFLIAVFAILYSIIWSKKIAPPPINTKTAITQPIQPLKKAAVNRAVQPTKVKAPAALCLTKAVQTYDKEWSVACKIRNDKRKQALNHCISEADRYVKRRQTARTSFARSMELYNKITTQCKQLYQFKSIADPNCTLPSTIANQVNLKFKKQEKSCTMIA